MFASYLCTFSVRGRLSHCFSHEFSLSLSLSPSFQGRSSVAALKTRETLCPHHRRQSTYRQQHTSHKQQRTVWRPLIIPSINIHYPIRWRPGQSLSVRTLRSHYAHSTNFPLFQSSCTAFLSSAPRFRCDCGRRLLPSV